LPLAQREFGDGGHKLVGFLRAATWHSVRQAASDAERTDPINGNATFAATKYRSKGEARMHRYLNVLTACGIGLASLLGYTRISGAEESPVTAIDVALEPDSTMIRHAQADNARLLKVFPKGFALDATHQPHVTMFQQFVRTADLDKVYDAANKVTAKSRAAGWKLKALKYYYIPDPPIGVAGIVVEPTDDLIRLQRDLLDAVAPFTVKTGGAGAFVSTEDGHDIQQPLIDYVTNFVQIGCGRKFNPHVTIGVATETDLNTMLAEPFSAFTFSPVGASVYQLGAYGTARKELRTLELKR
jgi:2'-5' RNA ligase